MKATANPLTLFLLFGGSLSLRFLTCSVFENTGKNDIAFCDCHTFKDSVKFFPLLIIGISLKESKFTKVVKEAGEFCLLLSFKCLSGILIISDVQA